jgi:GxxExxY protein
MAEIRCKEESYRIMGACFEVYKQMGHGYLEAVYQECLELEFGRQGIPFRSREALALSYKGQPLRQCYVPDFLCYEAIILEIKAVSALDDVHRAQLHNYLKATGLRLGLLVNFGHHPQIQYERVVR